jgi:type II secretory pathway predicted ATPase ExeA
MTDLGIRAGNRGKGELLFELNRYLIAQHAQKSTVVLIVDEAHLLSWELLEEIRLLTNLETDQQKLLQIVLIGQPELEEKLDRPELRQLKQRTALRCRLDPLSRQETQKYILLRLWLSGAAERYQSIFSDDAIDLIHEYSGGIPRLVNTICEAALISSFALQSPVVPPEVIHEVADEFCIPKTSLKKAIPGSGKHAIDHASRQNSAAV